MKYITKSEKETFELATKIAKDIKVGDVIILDGELGAGKTTFTKGLARALSVAENITSPTFTIMNQYFSGKIPLYHFDMYRIEDFSELQELGLLEILKGIEGPRGVCVIEWASNVKQIIPPKNINIKITKLGESSREFEITKNN